MSLNEQLSQAFDPVQTEAVIFTSCICMSKIGAYPFHNLIQRQHVNFIFSK